MTPEKAAELPEWSDADLIKLYRNALAMGWGGTTRTINGRTVTFAQPDVLLDLIERLERRVLDSESDGFDFGLAAFNPGNCR